MAAAWRAGPTGSCLQALTVAIGAAAVASWTSPRSDPAKKGRCRGSLAINRNQSGPALAARVRGWMCDARDARRCERCCGGGWASSGCLMCTCRLLAEQKASNAPLQTSAIPAALQFDRKSRNSRAQLSPSLLSTGKPLPTASGKPIPLTMLRAAWLQLPRAFCPAAGAAAVLRSRQLHAAVTCCQPPATPAAPKAPAIPPVKRISRGAAAGGSRMRLGWECAVAWPGAGGTRPEPLGMPPLALPEAAALVLASPQLCGKQELR